MADIINLMAEDNRNIIDDDAVPTLTLENSNAGGTALKAVASAGGTGLDVDVTGAGTAGDFASSTGKGLAAQGALANTIKSTASAAHALDLSHTVIASPTVAPLKLLSSAASGAIMELNVGLVSTASLTVYARSIPVKLTDTGEIMYIPGYKIL